MRSKDTAGLAIVLAFVFAAAGWCDETTAAVEKTYDLSGARSVESRYYRFETKVTNFAPDGARSPGNVFRLFLEARPTADGEDVEYVCRKFTLGVPGRGEEDIPALKDWEYSFYGGSEDGLDEKGQVFGIPHAKFAMLVDAKGNMIGPNEGYMIYNVFIDFHALSDVFAANTGEGADGIQALKKIGDRVVHESANSRPPVGLGGAMKKGSYFQNGAITLEFKGLSAVDGETCVLLGYDSGDSSYEMHMTPMPDMNMLAQGASHYQGDIYVELGSKWLRKATLHEIVVSQVTMGERVTSESVIERILLLEAMTKEDFAKL